ncbi:hypothetical protein WDA79_15565 [Streptomyces sp. A475]|uniref:hypothetical protein n=1 Tax=Streptomyces sp. A475 TaxID=3131976 RepID=UPI0030C9C6EA
MGLGGCILLIGAGAILAFGTDWQMRSVNLDAVGAIMMILDVIGALAFTSIAKRRRVVVPSPPPLINEKRDRRL